MAGRISAQPPKSPDLAPALTSLHTGFGQLLRNHIRANAGTVYATGAVPQEGQKHTAPRRHDHPKTRPCITGTEFRVWHDPTAARRGGWQSSPVRPYCGRAPRCFTKFQSSGKAIMSDPCMPTRISKEKLGHTLDEKQRLQGTGEVTPVPGGRDRAPVR